MTTLEVDHVAVEGSAVTLDFVGKSGVEHEITVKNRKLANRIRKIQELPGERLLQYVDEDGDVQMLDSADVNTYLREHSDAHISSKDFRTWGGSVLALDLMTAGEMSETEIVAQVSDALGNTPTVCRKYYIHPLVLEKGGESSTVEATEWLNSAENRFLHLLSNDSEPVRL